MKKTTVLIIDGGGRGSALVEKYLQSKLVSRVLAIPGNDLMGQGTQKQVKIFPQIKTTNIENIKNVCQHEKVDLGEVCQDDAVAVGVTDALLKEGFCVFGPTKKAGEIEWDKGWARQFMKDFNIPTPKFKICNSQKSGEKFIKSQKEKRYFIKASGLAAGKGAIFAQNRKQALEAITHMAGFGDAGKTFLIEECLLGEEFSSFAIVDGKDCQILGHAQDHKNVFNGDLGPNTGGMGCSSPPLVITPKIEKQIELIFKKTAEGLVAIDRPYRGILYLGGMIVKEGRHARRSFSEGRVWVIEFNARWGDPEAQVIVPAIKNDFFQLTSDVINGKIKKIKIRRDNFYRVAVGAASRGYPQDYSQAVGKKIYGLDKILKTANIKVFGAGVKKSK